MRPFIAAALALASACRWGGPEGDPTALDTSTLPPASGGPASAASSRDDPARPATAGAPQADTPAPGIDEAGPNIQGLAADDDDADEDSNAPGPASGPADPADGSAADAGSPPLPPPAESCAAPAGLVCDPVTNVGCLPLTQCLADPNAADAAYCVITSIALGTTCTQDLLSTSCPPEHSCVAGQCREYCYCDADCSSGACTEANDPGGSGAVRLCSP